MKKAIMLILSLIILIGFYFIFIKGEDKKEPLIGSWVWNVYDDVNYTYTFNKNNSGTFDTNGEISNFMYDIEDENLLFLYENSTETVSIKYKLEDNKLTIYNVYGEEFVYTKK